MSLNLAIVLETGAASRPEHTAVIADAAQGGAGRRLTYRELNELACRCASGLAKAGVRPGDKVAVLLSNEPEFLIAYFGVLKAGACVVPLNTLLKSGEIAAELEDSDSTLLIADEALLSEARSAFARVEACDRLVVVRAGPRNGTQGQAPVECGCDWQELLGNGCPDWDTVQARPDDTAVILYTAGSFGRPKGAELSHFSLFYNAALTCDQLSHTTPDDVSLASLPLFHAFGQTCVMNATLYGGGTLVLLPRFEPDRALQAIERHRVTILVGVPTMYWYLLHYPAAGKYDWSSLRLCCSGAAALPPEMLAEFQQRFGRPIYEGYGLTETSPVASFNPTDRPPVPGSVGRPIYGVEIRLVDEKDRPLRAGQVGEIVIRGHNVMKGYYKRPRPTAEALSGGWFHTGDLGKMDEQGYLHIVGRKKDLIKRGGLNIYPREVEDVLQGHPAVAQAAVVGIADDVMGEEIKAFVVLQQDESIEAEELIEYARSKVAAYKYPRYIEFRTELPKDAAGKVIKRQLRR
ncbi:MAG TPA: long-chain fatty acid--CoA ligase [Anaerolineae bacterium]|nr:long-chain fatty acid--CoA ligase [Anaerolineae bacterium]HNT05696.1 long-chain fatty acid--CoA ligase [Anaerolineae bacterium]